MTFISSLTIIPILTPSGITFESPIQERTELTPSISKIFKSLTLCTIQECCHLSTLEKKLKELTMDGIEMEKIFAITKTLKNERIKKAKTTITACLSILSLDMTLMKFILLIATLIRIQIYGHSSIQSARLKIVTEFEKLQCVKPLLEMIVRC